MSFGAYPAGGHHRLGENGGLSRAAESVLREGGSVIVLVPEIALGSGTRSGSPRPIRQSNCDSSLGHVRFGASPGVGADSGR